jgi:hypothetical protein
MAVTPPCPVSRAGPNRMQRDYSPKEKGPSWAKMIESSYLRSVIYVAINAKVGCLHLTVDTYLINVNHRSINDFVNQSSIDQGHH